MPLPPPLRLIDVTMSRLSQAVGLSFDDKLARAEALAASGIAVLDIGDVLSVPGKLLLVRAMANSIRGVALAACTLGTMPAIDAAWGALQQANQPVLRLGFPLADWYLQEHEVSQPMALLQVRAMVAYARRRCSTVELVALDATRCQDAFLCQVVATAMEAGASTVTLSDTEGSDLPLHYSARFRTVMAQVAAIHTITLGVAAHNRHGYALENTLAAIAAGARQVTVDESSEGHLKRAELETALGRLAAFQRGEDQGQLPFPPSH